MSSDTLRYVGDTEPVKLSLADNGAFRTDLDAVNSMVFLAVDRVNPSNTFGGPCQPLNPTINDYNCEYSLSPANTAQVGVFDCYVTVTEADGITIGTYGMITLTIQAKR